jgi:Tol biopolymer transport system component
MVRIILSALISLTLLAACGPQPNVENNQPPLTATRESTPAADTAAPTVQDSPAAANTTSIPTPPPPTPEPELPTIPQFSIVQDYTQELTAFFGDESDNIQIVGADYKSTLGLIALAACYANCDEVMGGRAFILLLDEDQQTPIVSIPIDEKLVIFDVDISPDGKRLFYSAYGQILEFDFGAASSRVFWKNPVDRAAPLVSISPDGKSMAVNASKQFYLLDLASGEPVYQLANAYPANSWARIINQQGNRLTVYTDMNRSQVSIYELPTLQVLQELTAPARSIAAVSPDGSTVALTTVDNPQIMLVDLQSGGQLWSFTPNLDPVTGLTFNPDGSHLLVSGFPNENGDVFEATLMIDAKTGLPAGSLLDFDIPNSIQFSADGQFFVQFNNYSYSIKKWGPKNAELETVETFIVKYFDAVSSGDYQQAAKMTRLDEYAAAEVLDKGLDPDDLPATFAELCAQDEVPCLPLGRIAFVGVDNKNPWDYLAFVTLQQPDGSEVLFDGISLYELVGVMEDKNGDLKIAVLHPGMRYPFD